VKPAWSVILLTTLLGAGQGLFLAGFVFGGPPLFTLVSVMLAAAGLAASFFHLGRPERAWRSAAMWRTSWLSREVIVLPLFMALAFAYYLTNSPLLGWLAALACVALFVCTGMVYACLPFLQEWRTPLTVVNFMLLGAASGLTLAAAFEPRYALAALAATVLAGAGRGASLVRNARLKPRSTLASAIGIKHPRIAQKAQGAMGGSFNTREFFHGRSAAALRSVKWLFLLGAFVVPAALLAAGLPALAFAVQYAGLLAERWFFFAQANHPQNLYYQVIS
jgi:DMSO reductase anchor subunit